MEDGTLPFCNWCHLVELDESGKPDRLSLLDFKEETRYFTRLFLKVEIHSPRVPEIISNDSELRKFLLRSLQRHYDESCDDPHELCLQGRTMKLTKGEEKVLFVHLYQCLYDATACVALPSELVTLVLSYAGTENSNGLCERGYTAVFSLVVGHSFLQTRPFTGSAIDYLGSWRVDLSHRTGVFGA